jgi:secreted Zn-dependent insulinase-like peptidase
MEDVVGLLFRYITLLQTSGATKWIFDEVNFLMNLFSIFFENKKKYYASINYQFCVT